MRQLHFSTVSLPNEGGEDLRKKTVHDIDVTRKRVLVRVDFNVPLSDDGKVQDDTRIRAVLPTINNLIDRRAKVILMSHLGRPKGVDEKYRLDPVAESLSNLLGKRVQKVDQTVSENVERVVNSLKEGDVILLENVRFNPGEKENDPEFSQKLASLADVYVNDAFGAAHRVHASVVGVTTFLPSVAGLLLAKEVETLTHLLEVPERPFCAVLGGNKVSDKIGVINKFLDIVDYLLTGGGMCFTFLKAKGLNIGGSVCEVEELEHAKEMLKKAERNSVRFCLPTDVVIADEFSENAHHKIVSARDIPDGWLGLDIGPETVETYRKVLESAKTIFWNGPLGVFEMESFSYGTKAIAEVIANSKATTIVGGGDSDAALRKYDLEDKITFVSTGGGASLKILEGIPLPGVAALMDKEMQNARCKMKNGTIQDS
jgi:3-phosphoglycerate kinase